MDGWSPRMFGLFDGDRMRLGVAPDGALLPVGVVGTTSATLLNLGPPSVDTPSNRPLGTSGSVDIVTMFDRLVGLMAIASSASLPCMTLASKFGGGLGAAAAGATMDASSATAAKAGAETVRTRDFRHCILASRHWAPAPGRSHATATSRLTARVPAPGLRAGQGVGHNDGWR